MEDKIKEVLTPEDFGVPGECAAEAMNYAKYMAAKSAMDAERYRWLRDTASRAAAELFLDRRGTRLAADRVCDVGIDIAREGANVQEI